MNCVDLARTLVRFPSLNPPGEEKACADYVANLLEQAGLKVELHEFAPGRPSMVARLRGASDLSPLAFTGHLDVVPLGEKPWSAPPFTFVGNFRETADGTGLSNNRRLPTVKYRLGPLRWQREQSAVPKAPRLYLKPNLRNKNPSPKLSWPLILTSEQASGQLKQIVSFWPSLPDFLLKLQCRTTRNTQRQ
jgi:hypothetical protein